MLSPHYDDETLRRPVTAETGNNNAVEREKAKDGSVLAVRMQVDQGNSGGLASAPWPAWHNDPAQGRSDLHLNSRGGLLSLHIHSQRSLGPTQKLPLVQNPQNP